MPEPVRLALLGDPVAHSRSPAIHRAALAEAGLEGDYIAIRADVIRLELAVADLRAGVLTGLNVTMPLKEEAAALADDLTPLAADAHSVNTLRRRNGRVEAHSTDAAAVGEILSGLGGFEGGAPVLVLGTGGAARAAMAALRGREVYVASRSPARAEILRDRFGAAGTRRWGTPLRGAVVVNATPLGMRGENLPAGVGDAAAALIDLPYGRQETPAVRTARSAGIPVVDGIEFLAIQAAVSFEWWTGEHVDSAVLAEAARNV